MNHTGTRTIAAAVTLLMLCAAGACGANGGGKETSTPKQSAETLMQAVRNADYTRIDQLTIANEDYSKDAKIKPVTPISDITVGDATQPSDDSATVPVSYKIGDDTVNTALSMTRDKDKGWLAQRSDVVDRYAVSAPTFENQGGLNLADPNTNPDYSVGGVAKPKDGRYVAVPGDYEVTYDYGWVRVKTVAQATRGDGNTNSSPNSMVPKDGSKLQINVADRYGSNQTILDLINKVYMHTASCGQYEQYMWSNDKFTTRNPAALTQTDVSSLCLAAERESGRNAGDDNSGSLIIGLSDWRISVAKTDDKTGVVVFDTSVTADMVAPSEWDSQSDDVSQVDRWRFSDKHENDLCGRYENVNVAYCAPFGRRKVQVTGLQVSITPNGYVWITNLDQALPKLGLTVPPRR